MRVPQFWRLTQRSYRLTGRTCPQCRAKTLSERARCEACGWPQAQAPESGILVLLDLYPEPERVPVPCDLRAGG